jgi:hypothetical protein
MSLNEAKGNMYPGVITWNPLGGECSHKCGYCSTKSLMRYPVIRAKYSGPPKLYDGVLKKCPGEFKTIFVVSQNDLFADIIPKEWISEILQRCRMWDNTYLFQTKNPRRFIEFSDQFPLKTIICTTIETNRHYPQMGSAPKTKERALAMAFLPEFTKHITIEPIMDFDLDELVRMIKIIKPNSVNIGADSKHHHLPEPLKEKLLDLIDELKMFTVIDQKTNLSRILNI